LGRAGPTAGRTSNFIWEQFVFAWEIGEFMIVNTAFVRNARSGCLGPAISAILSKTEDVGIRLLREGQADRSSVAFLADDRGRAAM
jgi:hypothetical protein